MTTPDREPTGWQTIDTAPRDGTVIHTHDGAYPVIAAWCEWPKFTTRRVGPWWNRKSERVEDGVTNGWYSVLFPFGRPTAQDEVSPHLWRRLPPLPWEVSLPPAPDTVSTKEGE